MICCEKCCGRSTPLIFCAKKQWIYFIAFFYNSFFFFGGKKKKKTQFLFKTVRLDEANGGF